MKMIIKFWTILLAVTVISTCIPKANAKGKEEPYVSARSAVLIEADSDDVIFAKNAYEMLPMASTTKIMTALVALERGCLDDVVTVNSNAVGIEGSSVYLKDGEKLKLRDLLYALMLASANDAAAAIAYHIAGGVDEFADMMNETAEALGLHNTHFTNPHGLDNDEHYTTAYDLARLTSYALKNVTFREIVSTKRTTVAPIGDGDPRVLVNHNKLLAAYEGAIGVKTGFTKKCGRCLVSAAERDGVTLVAVTLKDPDDWDDHASMLDFGFECYKRVELAAVGELYTDLPCIGGDVSRVRCSNVDRLTMTLPKDTRVAVRIEADRYFPAPVRKGDALATAFFFAEGKEIARLPLYAERDVTVSSGRVSFVERVLQFLGR